MNLDEVRELLLERSQKAGGKKKYSRQVGIHESYLSHVLYGKRHLSKKLLDAFDLEMVVTYFPKGTVPKDDNRLYRAPRVFKAKVKDENA